MWICIAYLHLPVFLSQIKETVIPVGVYGLFFFTQASHSSALRLDILLEAQEYSVWRSLKCLKLLNISEPVLKAALGGKPVGSCQCFYMTEVSDFGAETTCSLGRWFRSAWRCGVEPFSMRCHWGWNRCVLTGWECKSYFGVLSKARSLE